MVRSLDGETRWLDCFFKGEKILKHTNVNDWYNVELNLLQVVIKDLQDQGRLINNRESIGLKYLIMPHFKNRPKNNECFARNILNSHRY